MHLSTLTAPHPATPKHARAGKLGIILTEIVKQQRKYERLIRKRNALPYQAPESALLRALNPRLSFDGPPSNHHYAVYKDYVAFFNRVKSDPAATALPYNEWLVKREALLPSTENERQGPFYRLDGVSRTTPCSKQVTKYDVDWAERQAPLRNLSAERVVPTNFCPATRSYVLQDHTCYEALGNQIFAHRCEERVTQNHKSVATVKHERWLNTIERLQAAQKLLKQWNDRREQDRQSRVSFYKTFCPVAKPPIQSLTAALQRAAHKFTSPTLRTGALLDIWSDSVAEHIDAVSPKTSFYHYPTGAPFDLVTSGYDDSIPRKTNDSLPSEWEGFKKGRELMLGNVNQLDRSITNHLSHKECNPLVNTSGSEATNGAQIDRSSRDRRGDAVGRYKEAQLEPSVWTRCVCNKPFEANDGARFHSSTCKARYWEALNAEITKIVLGKTVTPETARFFLKELQQCSMELEEELKGSK